MKTIQFTVTDSEYERIKATANACGLSGLYASSILAKMYVMQLTGALDGIMARKGVFCSFTRQEFQVLQEYTSVKKGFAGSDPIATFVHKAAFDIMAKYPIGGRK